MRTCCSNPCCAATQLRRSNAIRIKTSQNHALVKLRQFWHQKQQHSHGNKSESNGNNGVNSNNSQDLTKSAAQIEGICSGGGGRATNATTIFDQIRRGIRLQPAQAKPQRQLCDACRSKSLQQQAQQQELPVEQQQLNSDSLLDILTRVLEKRYRAMQVSEDESNDSELSSIDSSPTPPPTLTDDSLYGSS